jgi:predicted Zn finger-like uncharacterized protein
MQVTCPNCGARYAVDPMAIGPSGRTVQCVRCSHRWREKAIAPASVAPPPLPPRPVPDFVIRPPSSYRSGLPALARPAPRTHWGLWLAAIAVVLFVLGIAAYGWRGEIMSRLPPEWRPFLDLDALRILLRQ